MAIKQISYYIQLLKQIQSNNDFSALEILDNETAVAFGYLNTAYGQLEANKAKFMEALQEQEEKKITNAELERKWYVTQNGQKMIKLKRDIQTLEVILRTVKNKIIILSIEKKEL